RQGDPHQAHRGSRASTRTALPPRAKTLLGLRARMNVFVDTVLLTYAALFPIVNPVGSAPLFLGLTQFCTDKERNSLATRVAFGSFFLLLGSLLIGSYVLEFFGISLGIVRIGGGLVVATFGWKLLNSDERPDGDGGETKSASPVPD